MEREISEDVLEVIKTRDLKAEAEADADVQMLLEKKMVKANDIIRAHLEGKLDLETCVGMLMMKCHRSYNTALLNIKLAKEYGCSSCIPYTGYGKKCAHHPAKQRESLSADVYMDRSRSYNPLPEQRKSLSADVYMDRSRSYNPLPEQTGLYRQVRL